MTKKQDYIQEHLEWEVLKPNEEITYLTFESSIYKFNENCVIRFSRNNQYNLTGTISGITKTKDELGWNSDNIKGTFISGETIIGYSTNRLFKYKFSGVVLETVESSTISVNPFAVKFQASFIFHKVEKSFVNLKTQTVSIHEWFLTGNLDISFPRTTVRSVHKSFKRLREDIDIEEEFTPLKSNSNSRDCLFVKLPDISFIVSKVPEEFGAKWSSNISIEYRQSFGRIPDEDEREAISELVSFIFGNQLLKIGQSSYNNSASLTLQEYQNPWGDNVVTRCQRPASPPIRIDNFQDKERVEILLSELLIPYIEQRDSLGLKGALWKYWIAKYSSLGINLPILSSAVETLSAQILKKHPEIKQYYIKFDDFVEIIEDELSSIEEKLDGNPHKEIILRKLKGSSQRGSNEKFQMMFEIIQLPVGSIEKKAIKARNKMAHSSMGSISEEKIRKTIRMTRAYETLFNRILLKILSYEGNYIDYYTFGHPNRKINESIPE